MYSLGIDIGTSGIRLVVMDKHQHVVARAHTSLKKSIEFLDRNQIVKGYSQNPHDWLIGFWNALQKIKDAFLKQGLAFADISHLALDGTSGTVLLTDQSGTPLTDALMYNDQRASIEADIIKSCAPADTAATGVSSGLAKILWLHKTHSTSPSSGKAIAYALNQADWMSGNLLGQYGKSDINNVLKMGYDAQQQCWPDWLSELLKRYHISPACLPEVFLPGEIFGTIDPLVAQQLGFNPQLKICAGTTDSTAAIIAAGATDIGQAVTSLGSTLVMKIISDKPVFNHSYGVYSQPYGKFWLVGGASNSGGEVLKHYFNARQIMQMTQCLDNKIQHNIFSPLDLNYYPLSSPGERFPVQDPFMKPVLSPRPLRDTDYFQALLEGMADIETLAYKRLVELGAPYPKLVRSIGGGAVNNSWRYIREKKLGVPVIIADELQAAAGAARLAQTSW